MEPNSKESLQPASGGSLLTETLPEVEVLQQVSHHPNIVSALYHCQGRIDRFKQHLHQSEPKFHASICDLPHPSAESTSPIDGAGWSEGKERVQEWGVCVRV